MKTEDERRDGCAGYGQGARLTDQLPQSGVKDL
jgi:hypothetical protein